MIRKFVILLGLLAIFFAGAVVGGVVVVKIVQKKAADRMNSDRWEPGIMTWLQTKLSLTTEQQEQVRPAVRRAVGQLRELRSQADDRRQSIFGEMFSEVGADLTPVQLQELRALLEKGKFRELTSRPATQPILEQKP